MESHIEKSPDLQKHEGWKRRESFREAVMEARSKLDLLDAEFIEVLQTIIDKYTPKK